MDDRSSWVGVALMMVVTWLWGIVCGVAFLSMGSLFNG